MPKTLEERLQYHLDRYQDEIPKAIYRLRQHHQAALEWRVQDSPYYTRFAHRPFGLDLERKAEDERMLALAYIAENHES